MKTLKEQLNEALVRKGYYDDDISEFINKVHTDVKPEKSVRFTSELKKDGFKLPSELSTLLMHADIYDVGKVDEDNIVFQYLRSNVEGTGVQWELEGTDDLMLVAHPSPSEDELVIEIGSLESIQYEKVDRLAYYIATLTGNYKAIIKHSFR